MCGAHTPVFDQVSEGIVDLKESVTLSVGAHVGDWFGSGRQGALDAEGGPLQTSTSGSSSGSGRLRGFDYNRKENS